MRSVRLSELDVVNSSGQRLRTSCIITGIENKQTKNGGDMISFTMVDGNTKRGCVSFSPSTLHIGVLNNSAGKVMTVVFDVKPYAGGEDGISCILYDIYDTAEEDGYIFDDFVASIENKEQYINTLNTYLQYCDGTIYGLIARTLLNKHWDKFCSIPAGSGQHHTVRGGLLQHSVCVAMSCLSDYNTYRSIYGEDILNFALLLSGALIHDIGKCFELDSDASGQAIYTEDSVLRSHLISGVAEIVKTATELGLSQYKEVDELVHLISSHHGRAEWGALIEPRMAEAWVLSSADDKDAKINKFYKEFGEAAGAQTKTKWEHGGLAAYARGVGIEQARANYVEYVGLVNEEE